MRRKKCRAVACSRKVPDDQLFCNVHLSQLVSQPAILTPLRENKEAPKGANPTIVAGIARATTAAVRFLAKKEGRSAALAEAERAQSFDPGQGGAGDSPAPGAREGFSATTRLTLER